MEKESLPVYRRLAGELRYQIGTGGLQAGDELPSYREAAERWGVNLHTVRRAYQMLETEGLVSISLGRRACVSLVPATSAEDGLGHFLRRVLADAAQLYGVDGASLLEHLESLLSADASPVYVAECSLSLANSMASQLETALHVKAVPMLITNCARIPAGSVVVSTHFHRKELRSVARRSELELLPLQPHPDFISLLKSGLRRRDSEIILLETDPVFAASVAGSLEAGLDRTVRIVISETPRRSLQRLPGDAIVIVSPRNWDRLTVEERERANVHQLLYHVPRDPLVKMAVKRGYRLNVLPVTLHSNLSTPAEV